MIVLCALDRPRVRWDVVEIGLVVAAALLQAWSLVWGGR
jgi:hypothetical protein